MKRITVNGFLIAATALALGVGGYFIFWWNQEITVTGDPQASEIPKELSPITGLPCASPHQRPMAVMLASDPIARPLSGIAATDIVFEMPVTPDGVTRMMAIFQCNDPEEVGSIRSARGDFLPLVGGFSAIYGHWGGEHDALDKLNAKILDNIDALKYEGSTYYRKAGIPKPHNGFTTLELLQERSQALKYSLTNTFEGYPHRTPNPKRNVANIVETIHISYPSPYTIRWEYEKTTNTYKRYRNELPEIDRTTKEQVAASNIIVLKTKATPLRDQYLTVTTTGKGEGTIYNDGTSTAITWKKDPGSLSSKLFFLDSQGKEVPLVPGKIWIEVTIN